MSFYQDTNVVLERDTGHNNVSSPCLKSGDNKKTFRVLLTGLSKAFNCLSHELLLGKLHACGFSIPALRLKYSYLKNRKQRTQINSAYSCWEEILFGVPQGSILGPLLFNIFL